MIRCAVVGASGFVGSAVASVLEESSEVLRLRAPRLAPSTAQTALSWPVDHPEDVRLLAEQIRGCDVVINAAGNPDASSRDHGTLTSANGALPGLVASAARKAGCRRFVHVSSAVVQGPAAILDESRATEGFSAYAQSKIIGERTALMEGPEQTVVYRPPSVHAPTRRVSRQTARIARSPLASVAGNGEAPTPQTLIVNVASAIAFLATTDQVAPPIVIHPWEGLSTGSLIRILGGKDPLHLPPRLARGVIRAFSTLGARMPQVAANTRRVEVMWFGQPQAQSWLTTHGWNPPVSMDGWQELAHSLAGKTGDTQWTK